eukprot:TRINITY_DN76628_c0_g1_i1.p1 TRINITY_DN76628_c0_g1~~TRINITY_DN76628_c0_g1_i1.p1  ORF type:complete len:360 (-),score=37.28 TRINITY_DN76628_c0_g1_i1:51-1055(-)
MPGSVLVVNPCNMAKTSHGDHRQHTYTSNSYNIFSEKSPQPSPQSSPILKACSPRVVHHSAHHAPAPAPGRVRMGSMTMSPLASPNFTVAAGPVSQIPVLSLGPSVASTFASQPMHVARASMSTQGIVATKTAPVQANSRNVHNVSANAVGAGYPTSPPVAILPIGSVGNGGTSVCHQASSVVAGMRFPVAATSPLASPVQSLTRADLTNVPSCGTPTATVAHMSSQPASPKWSQVVTKRRSSAAPRLSKEIAVASVPTNPSQIGQTMPPNGGDAVDLYYDQKELFVRGWSHDMKHSRSVKAKKRVSYQANKRQDQSMRDRGFFLDANDDGGTY